MKKEIEMLRKSSVQGISVWPKEGDWTEMEAIIDGPIDTPYYKGQFRLSIKLPPNYPIAPPIVRFITQIYHPNIDTGGRICLDILNVGAKGSWSPSLNIEKVLLSIQSLLSEPNPDDALMVEISEQFTRNYKQFVTTAKQWTEKYAIQQIGKSNSSEEEESEEEEEEDELNSDTKKRKHISSKMESSIAKKTKLL